MEIKGEFDELEGAKRLLEVIPRTMRVLRAEFREMARAEMASVQLSVPQFRTLVYLAEAPLNNGQLAELQGVSVAAMSRMVDGLVRRALLTRKAVAGDRRQVKVVLTPKGRGAVAKARARMQRRLARRLGALGPEPRRALSDGLAALEELLR